MLRRIIPLIFFIISTSINAQTLPVETVIQTGHTDEILSMDLSADGKLLLTLGRNGDAKLWDYESGREIRTFDVENWLKQARFTPDGKYVVAMYYQMLYKWDVSSGEMVKAIKIWEDDNSAPGDFNFGYKLACSPDGQTVAISMEHHLEFWSFRTGKKLKTIKPGKNNRITDLAMSPDGSKILIGCEDDKAMIYDFPSGKKLHTLPVQGATFGARHVCFNANGRQAATLYDIEIDGDGHDKLTIWDTMTGSKIKTVEYNEPGYVLGSFIQFSIDGSSLFTAGLYGNKYPVFQFDIASGQEAFQYNGHRDHVTCLAHHPDGRTMISASSDRKIQVWDTLTGELNRTIQGHFKGIDRYDISGDGMIFAAASTNVTGSYDPLQTAVHIWDLKLGRKTRSIVNIQERLETIHVNTAGTIVGTAYGESLYIWGVQDATLDHRYVIGEEMKLSDISPDGQKALITLRDEKDRYHWARVKEIDLSSGPMRGSMRDIFVPNYAYIDFAQYSPDGQSAVIYANLPHQSDVSGDMKYHLMVFDLNTLSRKQDYLVNIAGYSGTPEVRFSPDGKVMAAYVEYPEGGTGIATWYLPTGKPLKKMKTYSSIFEFNPDNQTLLSFKPYYGELKKFNYMTDKTVSVDTLPRWPGKQNIFEDRSRFSPNMEYFSYIKDPQYSPISLHDPQTGGLLVQLISVGGSDWAVVTPDGYFDCSEGAQRHMHFVQGTEIYNLDQFFEEFYRPGLLTEVLNRERDVTPVNLADKLNQSPPPLVEIVSPQPGQRFTEKEIEVRIRCTDLGGGVEDIRLYHNDKLVSEDTRGIRIVSKAHMKTFRVSLLNEENRLRATAFSTGRIEARPHEITIVLKGLEAVANSHIFVIGIDQYRNSVYNLNYAKSDASTVKSLIQSKSSGLFRNIVIHELYDDGAQAEAIQSTFNTIISQAQPQDIFTFFYAGHGVMLPDEGGKEQFYLIPTEVTNMYDEEKVQSAGISGKKLVDLSRQIPARKQLFIIDACQAGSLSETFALRGAAEQKALAQLARSAGVHVVASTGSEQFAAEFQELGHGLFTHALIEAIQGKADGSPKDGRVTVREINSYLENVIPELSEKYRGQPQYPVVFSKGQDFPVVVE